MVTWESVPLRIAQIRLSRCLRTTWGSSSSPRRICTASLGSKDNFTCHHSMNARWNSFVMLCAGKRNFSRTAMSVRYVCPGTRNSMRVRCIKRQLVMLSCAPTYLPEPSDSKCKPVNKKFLFNVSRFGFVSWSGKPLINVTNIQVFVDHQHH